MVGLCIRGYLVVLSGERYCRTIAQRGRQQLRLKRESHHGHYSLQWNLTLS